METQPIIPEASSQVPDNVVIEGGYKKKKARINKSATSGYKKSRGGVCGSVSMKLCKMSPQCQYIRGRAKKGSKPKRKGYCKSRPMEDSAINTRIQNLFQDGELEGGRKSRNSISKLQARAKKLCVKASGSKSAIRQRIKSAKKSKQAIAKRCSRKRM